ncbi:hypothetical protein C0585_08455 [Candidatus Woesearchaeota archaeon]|nr:MAG: hypothetical protein C0585_08455 [Candidatus Woesearchaeota archaeon]
MKYNNFLGKAILFMVVLATVFLVACSSEQVVEDQNSASAQTSVNIVQPAESEATGDRVDIDMIARQWEFEPSTIEVNKGDTVVLTVTNIDVEHGIAIPEFNVDLELAPGTTSTVEFVADKTGEFKFNCNTYCGAGHELMEGILIVN